VHVFNLRATRTVDRGGRLLHFKVHGAKHLKVFLEECIHFLEERDSALDRAREVVVSLDDVFFRAVLVQQVQLEGRLGVSQLVGLFQQSLGLVQI